MWRKPIPFGTVVFGTAYIGCGLVQVTAGIVFLVHPTVLRIGSNIWTGIFNMVFGFLLLTASRHAVQPRSFVVIHTGVLLVNLCNLVLMELREWRAFLAANRFREFLRNGDITALIAVYFSTTVPTVVAFVVSFLAVQYNCCVLVTRKAERKEVLNRIQASVISSSSNSTVVYDWVFHEDDVSHDDDGDGDVDESKQSPDDQSSLDLIDKRHFHKHVSMSHPPMSVPLDAALGNSNVTGTANAMQTFSSPFRNVPATFDPGNWSDIMKNEKIVNNERSSPVATYIIVQDEPQNYVENSEALSDDVVDVDDLEEANDVASEPSEDVASERRFESMQHPARPIREILSRLRVCEHVARSDDVRRSEWRPPSRLLISMSSSSSSPMAAVIDSDSLVHLTHLELLARQWRIEHEHERLHQLAKLMIRNSQQNGTTQSNA